MSRAASARAERRTAERRTAPRRRLRETPLARLAAAAATAPRATPLDLLARARDRWLAGERLDLGKLAAELGVGRATVFRWAGSRDRLYAEVISSLGVGALERARRDARGTGVDYLVDVSTRLLRFLATAAPLRAFVQRDPELAMRILMSRDSPVERRWIAIVAAEIGAQVAAGRLRPAMPTDALAYVLVRIAGSFMYRDAISGDAPDIDAALTAIRILIAAEAAPRKRRR